MRAHASLRNYANQVSGPYIFMLAYLPRIINRGGQIYRKHALVRRSITLFVSGNKQNFVLGLKSKLSGSTTFQELEVAAYMDKAQIENHLIIFDRNTTKSWKKKISHEIFRFESKNRICMDSLEEA